MPYQARLECARRTTQWDYLLILPSLNRVQADSANLSFYATNQPELSGVRIKARLCSTGNSSCWGPQGGRGGSSWTSAQAWVSRWPTAWARCKGNVIDEPTAPQNLELGQVDLSSKVGNSPRSRRKEGFMSRQMVLRMEIYESAPLFKADNATLSFIPQRTARSASVIRAGTRARPCLNGNSSCWGPQGVEARIFDAHPRSLLTLR
jgi:hypothetical protein